MGWVESGKSELRGNLGLRYPVPKISLPVASTGDENSLVLPSLAVLTKNVNLPATGAFCSCMVRACPGSKNRPTAVNPLLPVRVTVTFSIVVLPLT